MTEQGPAPTVEGGLDEPAELEPDRVRSTSRPPRTRPRSRRLGGGGRRGAAQGQAAGRRRPRRAGVGEAHPDHARRHRGHSAGHARPARGPGDQRPADAPGRLGRPRTGPRRRREARPRGGARRPRERRHPPLAAGERRHRPGRRARRRPARPGAGRPRRPSTRRGVPRVRRRPASCTRRTNLGVPASEATAELAGMAWQAGVRGFVVDATTVHDRGASDVQELGYSLAAGGAYLRTLTDAGLDVDRGGRAGGVPVRRHRRAVPDDREAPRRAPAVGAGARAQRCSRRQPVPSSGSTR